MVVLIMKRSKYQTIFPLQFTQFFFKWPELVHDLKKNQGGLIRGTLMFQQLKNDIT